MMYIILLYIFRKLHGCPSGTVVKNMACNAKNTGSISGLEDSTCLGATKPMGHN